MVIREIYKYYYGEMTKEEFVMKLEFNKDKAIAVAAMVLPVLGTIAATFKSKNDLAETVKKEVAKQMTEKQ